LPGTQWQGSPVHIFEPCYRKSRQSWLLNRFPSGIFLER